MAFLFGDTFDHYATAEILQKWNTSTSATIGAYGRNSTNGMRHAQLLTPNSGKTVTPGSSTAIVGMALRLNLVHDSTIFLFHIKDSGTTQVSVGLTIGSGIPKVYRGAGSALLATASVSLTTGVYYYIELKTVIHGTTGTIDLQVNGVNVATATGLNTAPSGVAQWNGIQIGGSSVSGSTVNLDIDDLYVLDSTGGVNDTFLGPVRGKALFADGAGTSTDFTPSAGSNFQCVDETSTDGDTTYNTEGTVGDHDTYAFGAIGLTGTVRAVQTNLMVRSDGAGAETVAAMARVNSVDYQGSTQSLTTSYTDVRQVYNVSPNTSVAWTVSEIDASEFGIKLVS